MYENERQRELDKEKEILYKTTMKEEFQRKFVSVFNKAIDQYIEECNPFPIGVGKCLEYVRDFVKENI